MSRVKPVAVALLAAAVSWSCSSSSSKQPDNPAPVVPVGGGDVSTLAGKWVGEYSSTETGRTGSITFELKSGGKVARGDVLMVPKGGFSTAPAGADPLATMPQVLQISFVNAEGGVVKGTMDPYQRPVLQLRGRDDVRRPHLRRHDRGDLFDEPDREGNDLDRPLEDDAPEAVVGTAPMSAAPITLDRFILEEQQASPGATGELSLLLMRFGVAGKRIASALSRAGLTGALGAAGSSNVQGEEQKKLDVVANEILVETFDYGRLVTLAASEEMEEPVVYAHGARGRRLRRPLRSARRLLQHRRQRHARDDLLGPPAPGGRPDRPAALGAGAGRGGLRPLRAGRPPRLHDRGRASTSSRSTRRSASSC